MSLLRSWVKAASRSKGLGCASGTSMVRCWQTSCPRWLKLSLDGEADPVRYEYGTVLANFLSAMAKVVAGRRKVLLVVKSAGV